MNRLIALAATFICIITSDNLIAQKYAMKETEENLINPFRDIFSFNNNEYIEVGFQGDIDKESNVYVSCFDATMKQHHTNQVAGFAGKRYRAGFAVDNRLIAVVSDNDENMTAQEINCKTGALVGSPVDLFQLRGNKRNAIYKGSSANKNFHCVVGLGKKAADYGETFIGAIMDKNMKVVNTFKHVVPQKLKKFFDVYVLVNDNGELTLIYSGHFGGNLYFPVPVYTAVHVNKSGTTTANKLIDFPEGEVLGMAWEFKGNMIQFTGLHRLKAREGHHTLLTGELDPVQQKVTNVKETKIIDHLIVPGFYKEKFKKSYIPFAGLLTNAFDHKDGSRTLVFESKSFGPLVHKSNNGATSYSYTADNVFVMRLNAARELQWVQVVGKDQAEWDTDFHVGAASMMDDKETLHLVFYDNSKNTLPEPVKKPEYNDPNSDKTGLAAVQIAPDGAMTKTFITEKKESKWHFVPKHVYAFRNNELVFLSINEKGWTFNSNQKGVYGKSGWHLGIIQLL